MVRSAQLFVLCGKISSGKSTLAAKLADDQGAVVIAEDDWLATLFSAEMHTLKDYVRCAGKLRAAMAPHIVSLLQAGTPVVLDFQANTVESRAWMRGIAEAANVLSELHFLDVSDEVCKARLRARNASGAHAFQVSEAEFDQVAAHFVTPDPAEGFEIITHGAG